MMVISQRNFSCLAGDAGGGIERLRADHLVCAPTSSGLFPVALVATLHVNHLQCVFYCFGGVPSLPGFSV